MTDSPDDFKPYLVTCDDCGRVGDQEYTHQWSGKRYCVECRPACCAECGFPMPEDHEKHGLSGDLCSELCAYEGCRQFPIDESGTSPVADPEDRGEDEAGLTQAIRATTPVGIPAPGVNHER